MSTFNFGDAHQSRNRLLTSVAALALIASGAIGVAALTRHSAQAAAVDMSGLQIPGALSFAGMIERVRPAVVSIKVEKANAALNYEGEPNPQQGSPPQIRRFFRNFGNEKGPPRLAPQPTTGEGSGFFVSSDGYIVTNNHLVDDAKSVTVTMNDGETVEARVVGADARSDLAVLKVDEKGDYPFVAFAREEPKIGDWVVAIGNPYGLGGTATAGIVSAKGRGLAVNPYDDFIQIDASINQGNSGGPTFNTQGQVVGVNTAIVSPSGGSVGIAFAIPADKVERIVDVLEHGGSVAYGYLGVAVQPVTREIADSLSLNRARGVIVDRTEPGTTAERAGLEEGDVITRLDGQPVTEAMDVTRRIGDRQPGDKVELSFWRDGVEKTVSVILGAEESRHTAKVSPPPEELPYQLGVELAPASEADGVGVAIVAIDPNGAAAAKGLNPGDIILKVSGKPVSRPEDVTRGIADAEQQGKKAVLFRVKTVGGDRFVAFALQKA